MKKKQVGADENKLARPTFFIILSFSYPPHFLTSLSFDKEFCTLRLPEQKKTTKNNKKQHKMADNEGQSSKPPPGLSLAAPPPAEAPSVPYTAEQERAYRNRSSGSWFDLSPAANAAPAYGRGGGGGRRGGSRGSGKDRGGFAPPPMHFPPPPPTQEQLPPPPPPRFSVRAGTTPLELVPVGTRCTGVVAALRESFGFIR